MYDNKFGWSAVTMPCPRLLLLAGGLLVNQWPRLHCGSPQPRYIQAIRSGPGRFLM